MSTPTKTYPYSWTCKRCAHQNSFERTKYQAAFEHRPTLLPCDQCGGTKYSAASLSMPDIDLELLEMWAADDDLQFLEQDKNLIVADTPLPIFKVFLGNKPKDKMREGLLVWMSVLNFTRTILTTLKTAIGVFSFYFRGAINGAIRIVIISGNGFCRC